MSTTYQLKRSLSLPNLGLPSIKNSFNTKETDVLFKKFINLYCKPNSSILPKIEHLTAGKGICVGACFQDALNGDTPFSLDNPESLKKSAFFQNIYRVDKLLKRKFDSHSHKNPFYFSNIIQRQNKIKEILISNLKINPDYYLPVPGIKSSLPNKLHYLKSQISTEWAKLQKLLGENQNIVGKYMISFNSSTHAHVINITIPADKKSYIIFDSEIGKRIYFNNENSFKEWFTFIIGYNEIIKHSKFTQWFLYKFEILK